MTDRLLRQNQAFFASRRADHRQQMLTGRLLADGSVTTADAPTNKTWVRATLSSREKTAAWGVITTANVPVVCDYNLTGELEIVGTNWNLGTPMFGGGLPAVAQPPIIGELSNITIDALGFKPGRVRPSSSGGTNVAIDTFNYNDTSVPTSDLDIAASYPSGANLYGRVIVYYDPSTGTVGSIAGVNDYDLLVLLAATTVSVPTGYLPLGAVIVHNDGSGSPEAITAANRFESWRNFLSPNGYLLTGEAVARTIASGVLTVGNETRVVVSAESGTADDLNTLAVTGLARDLWLIAASGHTITLKHGVDNIFVFSEADLDFNDAQAVKCLWDGTNLYAVAGGGGSASAFTDLSDVPASYSGQAGQLVAVNGAEDGLEFIAPSAGGGSGALLRSVGTVLWDSTLTGSASFDTNSADDLGNSGAFATDYDWIELIWELRGAASAGGVNIRIAFNNDTTDTNYQSAYDLKGSADFQGLTNNGRNMGAVADAASTANYFGAGWGKIVNPGGGAFKTITTKTGDARTNASHSNDDQSVTWRSTAAITRIAVNANHATTTFVAGSRLIVIGYKREAIGGLDTSSANVSNPPTDAELDSEFGTPATVGNGYMALLDDNGADSAVYLVASNGTSWWYTALTKAT